MTDRAGTAAPCRVTATTARPVRTMPLSPWRPTRPSSYA